MSKIKHTSCSSVIFLASSSPVIHQKHVSKCWFVYYKMLKINFQYVDIFK